MDLPDIKLVVQWRATCGLNTLFQRFGRAARGKGETGVGILLVDKKDLDDENGQRGSSKRKATNQNGPTPKRRAPTSNVGQQATTESRCEPSNGDLMEVDVADSIDSSHAIAAAIKPQTPVSMDPNECRKRYHKQGGNPGDRSAVGKGRLARGNDLGSPMDDYINAHLRGVCCQRIIPSTFFGNDRCGKSICRWLSKVGSNFIPKKATTRTLPVTPTIVQAVAVVVPHQKVIAVSSVPRRHSRSTPSST